MQDVLGVRKDWELKTELVLDSVFDSVADLEICKGGFGLHIHSAPPSAVRRIAKWRSVRAKRGNFFYVFFLVIRKRSRSISAHSGHVPRRKED